MSSTVRAVPRKASNLITQDMGAELLVVDRSTDQVHALTGVTAALWRSLDEGRLPQASESELAAALTELTEAGLLEQGMSRRALLQRAGTIAVAGTVITIAMPEVMAAASTTPPVGTNTVLDQDKNVSFGAPFTLTATVLADDLTVPLGSITLTDQDNVTGAAGITQPLVNGVTTFNLTAPSTNQTFNPDTFTATYVPSANYATSGDTASVGWMSGQPLAPPTIVFGPVTTTHSTTANPSYSWTVTVRGTNGHAPTGKVTLTATNASTTSTNPQTLTVPASGTDSTATFVIKNSTKKNRTVSLKIAYAPASGDPYYSSTSATKTYRTS